MRSALPGHAFFLLWLPFTAFLPAAVEVCCADVVLQVAGNRPLVVTPPPPPRPRWILGQDMTTVWPVTTDAHLAHGDFIEQGGLRSAADLGRALGHADEAREYDRQADALSKAMESDFGATVEGFATYRYHDGNAVLRSWICLPLCMGLMDRRAGTIAALFSPRLWTDGGLASQAGDQVFWDRSTLYGFRGVFQAGETATGLRYLEAHTRRRLLGEHVPYPVECGPEGGKILKQAESLAQAKKYRDAYGLLLGIPKQKKYEGTRAREVAEERLLGLQRKS